MNDNNNNQEQLQQPEPQQPQQRVGILCGRRTGRLKGGIISFFRYVLKINEIKDVKNYYNIYLGELFKSFKIKKLNDEIINELKVYNNENNLIIDNFNNLNNNLNNLNLLPNEIFYEIFNFLDLKFNLLIISKINCKFRNLINNWNFILNKLKYENIYSFILLNEFKQLLYSPELKYFILIKPNLILNKIVNYFLKNLNKNFIICNNLTENNNYTNNFTKNYNNNYKYEIFVNNNQNQMVDIINNFHKLYKIQIPPHLQQLAFLLPYIASIDNENKENNFVKFIIQPLQLLNNHKESQNLQFLFCNFYLFTFGNFKRKVYNNFNNKIENILFTIRTDYSDLYNYGNVVLVDLERTTFCNHHISFHLFIEHLLKEINSGNTNIKW